MKAEFHILDASWERKEHFDYYYSSIKSKYNINAKIDITDLLIFKQEQSLKFFPLFLYIILQAVNQNKEFRMSFNAEGLLGYWSYVVPSYTIFHQDDKTFSDLWSPYHEDFQTFYDTICADMHTYRDVKGIKIRPHQPPNFCPVSSLPWLSFTGINQDTYSESLFLFPLIRFGKFFEEHNKFWLPLGISVHHAVADGYHTCKLINDIQDLSRTFSARQ